MISNIPSAKRSSNVLNNLHIMITRFTQLREMSSTFDTNHNITGIVKKSAEDKPLADYLSSFKNSLYWIMMVAKNVKKTYALDKDNYYEKIGDIEIIPENQNLLEMSQLFRNYKTNEGIEGIILKGLFDANSFKNIEQFLVEGKPITFLKDSFSNEIIVSKTMATRFNFKLNDRIILYFFSGLNDAPRARKVSIVGIFNTGLDEYDKSFSLCDYRFINHLNKESNDMIQGYEITLDDIKNSNQVEKEIFDNYLEPPLEIYSLEKRFGNVFSWLQMMKMNEKIIIIIMMIIALINMISALLILILERTPMIGILKSLGMSNLKIQLIFLYSSFYIIGIGLFLGTLLGVGLCLLQQKFGFLNF
jgi:ABC-type lipoprotein release transport system permease subunit